MISSSVVRQRWTCDGDQDCSDGADEDIALCGE